MPSDEYNVTLISPQTYFAFTPLLPSACVGTVEVRSLVEPLRKLVARVRGHYLMGTAVDLDMSERLLEVEVPSDQGEGTMRAYVPCELGLFSPRVSILSLGDCFTRAWTYVIEDLWERLADVQMTSWSSLADPLATRTASRGWSIVSSSRRCPMPNSSDGA